MSDIAMDVVVGGYPVCPGGTGNGFYVDCDGACFTAELTQLGDQVRDMQQLTVSPSVLLGTLTFAFIGLRFG